MTLCFLVFYSLFSGYGLYHLKLMTKVFPPDYHTIIGIICYGIGFIMWLTLLKKVDLTLSFPLATGSLMISTQLLGIFLLKEKITLLKTVGIVIILIGIFIVSMKGDT